MIGFWARCIEETILCGYDQVISISEITINQLLISLWKRATNNEFDALLCKFKHQFCDISFEGLEVKLLSSGKVVIFVTLRDGQLRVKR